MVNLNPQYKNTTLNVNKIKTTPSRNAKIAKLNKKGRLHYIWLMRMYFIYSHTNMT